MNRYFPFLAWWPQVNVKSLKSDFLAGITNAVIVLPQGVAFAIIAGLPPVYGLYTAIVTSIIAVFFGSSWHLISGPTTAISIVIYSSLSPLATPSTTEFIELALLMTFMAGMIQWILGISRLGTLVNFVSHSVVVGFTSGAAILIGFSQMRHVLGISAGDSSQMLDGVMHIIKNIKNSHLLSISIGLITILTALMVRRISIKLPHLLIGMLSGSLLSYFMLDSKQSVALVGKIPNDLPPFSIPSFSFENMQLLVPKAFAKQCWA